MSLGDGAVKKKSHRALEKSAVTPEGIDQREARRDILNGMDDAALMKKYKLSREELLNLFAQLPGEDVLSSQQSASRPSSPSLLTIRNQFTDEVLFSGTADTLKDLVEQAIHGAHDLTEADLAGADLFKLSAAGAQLSEAGLYRTNLQHANLSAAILYRAELSQALLKGAILKRAELSEANLVGADISEADLSGAFLVKANLDGANLANADLTKADLTEARLIGANLRCANLEAAILVGAELEGADLTSAKLSGSNLDGADLTGANLSNTIFE